MWTTLYWMNGPWPGRLALAARPRGGDWLSEEMEHWHQSGVSAVLSLLTPEEEVDLDLEAEKREAAAHGLEFFSFPIRDREVPDSESELVSSLENLDRALTAGKHVVVHCRQGIGRTGLVAACLFALKGIPPAIAVAELSSLRGATIPETLGQRVWIDHFAASLMPLK